MRIFKIIIITLLVGGSLFVASNVLGQDLNTTELTTPIPIPGKGTLTEVQSSNIGLYIQNIYRFSLGIGGLFAMLFIVYGGIIYTASAGNPAKQGEAKDIITNAVWGLVLLLGAFLILNTINPALTGLNIAQPTAPAPPSQAASFNIKNLNISQLQNLRSQLLASDPSPERNSQLAAVSNEIGEKQEELAANAIQNLNNTTIQRRVDDERRIVEGLQNRLNELNPSDAEYQTILGAMRASQRTLKIMCQELESREDNYCLQ